MASVNRAIIIGNLGKDPEIKAMPSGEQVANFSIATSSSWKDKQTGEKKEDTQWHRIVTFGRLAEVCGQYLRKGSQVFVSGEIRTRKWQDKDGNDRYTTEIVAREMQMLGGRPESASNGDQSRPQSAPPADDFDDDIPFS